MNNASVLILGAGPTGLALACDLRSRGVDAQVVDRFRGPATTTRALGVQPRGRQILERLGALPTEASSQTRFNVYVDGRAVLGVDLEVLGSLNDDGALRVPQTAVERRLRERLRDLGTEPLWGHEVIHVREDIGGVEVDIRTAHGDVRMRADWCVGCDGAHSIVRDAIGATFDGTAYPETFLLGDVRLDWDMKEGAAIYLNGSQILTIASLRRGIWRIGAALPPRDPLADRGRDAMTVEREKSSVPSQQGLERLQQLFAAGSGDSETRLSDPSWLSIFRINRRMASTFRRGRLLIAGDAAHLSSPLGGQGMNTGLADAFNLGWKLALVVHKRASEALIDTYEQERRPAAQQIERATTQWTNVLLGKDAGIRLLRRYVIFPAMQFRIVQSWVLTRRRALQSNYRGGPLAPQVSSGWLVRRVHPGPQPGDEAPDARGILVGEHRRTGIGREIGNRWGLIFFGSAGAQIRACSDAVRYRLGNDLHIVHVATNGATHSGDTVIEDDAGAIARAYRPASDTAILIRPDGHLAWRSRSADVSGVIAWLDKILATGS